MSINEAHDELMKRVDEKMTKEVRHISKTVRMKPKSSAMKKLRILSQ
jgi:hypothetical protein